MLKRSAVVLALLTVPLLTLVAGADPHHRHAPRPRVEQCPMACGVKLEHGPWKITGTEAVTGVCIKAGRHLFSFTSDGTNGCYTVNGLGTANVTVRSEHESHDCKDISNVVFYHDCSGGGGGGTPPPAPGTGLGPG